MEDLTIQQRNIRKNTVDRRSFLRIGGLGLCGLTMLDVLRAANLASAAGAGNVGGSAGKAKSLIVCWLGGGPPHTDMFDMKPESPADRRGEFKPISSKLPSLPVCELMPNLAKMTDRFTIIRSCATLDKPGNHGEGPLYWLTGNPRRRTGTEEYPMWGSAISKLKPGPADLPTFASLTQLDSNDGSRNLAAQSYLGPAHAPFIFEPTRPGDPMTKMLAPELELSAFEREAKLLQTLDSNFRRLDAAEPLIEGLDKYQQKAFAMLRSPKMRQALDISKESPANVERYKKLCPAKPDDMFGDPMHFLYARRLVEAGVPVVHFKLGYWDWHADNFKNGRRQIPMFDAGLSYLLDDLKERGMMESTIVLALGEMGRTSAINGGRGRDHQDYAQFVLAAGGGFKAGNIVGATDKLGDRVSDNFYKVESFARTLYHLMGVDADATMHTPSGRPIKVIAEEAPIIKEAIV